MLKIFIIVFGVILVLCVIFALVIYCCEKEYEHQDHYYRNS